LIRTGLGRRYPRAVGMSVLKHFLPPATSTARRVDAGIALATFAGSLGLLAVGDPDLSREGGAYAVLAVLLTALASLPLIARRRAPLAVFVLTALASSALALVATPGGPPLGPTIALFGLAAAGDGSRRAATGTVVVTVVLLAAHAGAFGVADGHFPGAELLFGALLWGGTWLAGDRARLRAERIAELEERALRAERDAEERTRIARDLHDSAGHAINVILVHAGAGRLQAAKDPEASRSAFGTIEAVARETVGEIDQLVGVLREDPSRDAGDEVAPPAGIAALEALVERHRSAGLDVKTTVRGDRRALSSAVERSAYRIAQEALTNAARHGDGSAQLEVEFGPNALDIAVSNPVPRPGSSRETGGHGLVGMRERAAMLGGSLDIRAEEGRFEVHAHLPFARHEA
jgi:signal transduction histidine kinase